MKNNGAASVDPNVNDLYLKSLSRCVPITTADMRVKGMVDVPAKHKPR